MKNIMKKFSIAMVVMALAWSCGKDDGPTAPKNTAPVIAAQEFTAFEGITDTQVIGTVTASDADKDALTFTIKTNDNNLFKITGAGALSLAAGKTLDFATATQHSITVEVSDGTDSSTSAITIKVTQTTIQNSAPEIADQEFTAAEDIADTGAIGTVTATDVDGDNLAFTIAADDNELFQITEAGELSLATGKTLDFETATEHSITVQVGDGTANTQATVTIKVSNVIETLAEDPASFITTWKTEAANEEIEIGTNELLDYDYTIDWGDGTVEELTELYPSHIYASAGTHTVAIKGQFPHIFMDGLFEMAPKLLSIEQWGTIAWQNMNSAFSYCENMVYNATDKPDLSNVTNMSYMFSGATAFNGDISGWDTPNVTTVLSMFEGATAFNQDISSWETGNVTNMAYMFNGATAFDQDLGNWDIGNVTNMANMLSYSGMSVANLDATLTGWRNFADQNNGPYNIKLGLDGLTICVNTINVATYLGEDATYNWSFTVADVVIQDDCN